MGLEGQSSVSVRGSLRTTLVLSFLALGDLAAPVAVEDTGHCEQKDPPDGNPEDGFHHFMVACSSPRVTGGSKSVDDRQLGISSRRPLVEVQRLPEDKSRSLTRFSGHLF